MWLSYFRSALPMLLSLHLLLSLLSSSQHPLCLEILPIYWLFSFLINQSEWHISTVYEEIPQRKLEIGNKQ